MAIVIDVAFKLTGASTSPVTRLVTKMRELDDQLSRVNGQLRQMLALLHSVGQASGGVQVPRAGGGGGGRAGGGALVARGPAAPRIPTDVDRFRQAFAEFRYFNTAHARTGQGGMHRQAALQASLALAQRMAAQGNFGGMAQLAPHLYPRQRPGFGRRLASAVFSTRVGFGAGGMQIAPLIGRLAALHPAIGAAVLALGAFTAAIGSAIASLDNLAKNRAVLGGSAAETAMASRNARFAGLDPQQAAAALREAIQSGAGASFAAAAGINITDGPFGDNNYARKINQAMQFIAEAPSFEAARRRAEAFGMPEAARLQPLDAGWKSMMYSTPNARDDEAAIAATKLNLAMVRLNSVLDQYRSRLAPFIEWLAYQIRKLADQLEWLLSVIDAVDRFVRGGNSDAARKENTRAIEQNTRELRAQRDTFGGGERASAALPSRLRGDQINQAAISALGMGVRV